MGWTVLKVFSEAKAFRGFRDLGIPLYSPREVRWKTTRGERQRKEQPLLPGYAFLPPDQTHRLTEALQVGYAFLPPDQTHRLTEALQVEGIYGFLPVPIPAEPIEEIRTRELRGEFDYCQDRRKAQKAKRRAMKLTDFARLDREEILQELKI
jgi:hypothetical protein